MIKTNSKRLTRRRDARRWLAGTRLLGAARGQSMVELALCLPILIVILLGVTDFSRMVAAGVVAQNAAKQVAVFAARHHMSPVACLQPQAQQLLSGETSNGQSYSVALADVAPATTSYAGELDVNATVDNSITFISPFLKPWGNPAHPMVIHATDTEHVMSPQTAGTAPVLTGATVTATRSPAGATNPHDVITVTMPSTWTPDSAVDSSTTPVTIYRTTFHLFESVTNISPSPGNGCPVLGSVQLQSTPQPPPYTYTIDHDLDPNQDQSNPANRQYWIVATAPVVPSSGQAGASSAFLAVP